MIKGSQILRLSTYEHSHVLTALLGRYGLSLEHISTDTDIPGSYWGDEEAGLIGRSLLARSDTPVHSVLHEACHYICMDHQRREALDTNAGGDYDEENAVCYLQVVLADELPGVGRERMFNDMDAWGYSFRLGSTRNWFESDAEDAFAWLTGREILNSGGLPTYKLRAK